MFEIWARICDALAAHILTPIDVFWAFGVRPPMHYVRLLWRLASPFVAASLTAQRLARERKRLE